VKRVLVLLDGSDLAIDIVDDAIRAVGTEGSLLLLHVGTLSDALTERVVHAGSVRTHVFREYLDAVAHGVHARGVAADPVELSPIALPAGIHELTGRIGADLIAYSIPSRSSVGSGWHGLSVWPALARSPVPLLLRLQRQHRESWPEIHRPRILVPFDETELSSRALLFAAKLAAAWSAQIEVVSVAPPYASEAVIGAARKAIEVSSLGIGGVQAHTFTGYAVEELCIFARAAAVSDVVMGGHVHTGLSRVLGSVSNDILHRLPIPLFLVPAVAQSKGEEAVQRGLDSVAAGPD
jgi:nucleotide-binding universal stress UspA family protein